MAPTAMGRRLVACLLNLSEARRKDLVETVAQAALFDKNGGRREGTSVLNIFNDHDYNRSVITIVSNIDSINEAVLSACEMACELIDLSDHTGAHPCMGAVDLVPIYPLGEEVGLQDCANKARLLAQGLIDKVKGTSAFLFGCADLPLQRSLALRRKEMGWFKHKPGMQAVRPDLGPVPQKRYGLTGVGASPYVMNCNVTIDSQDLALGRSIATEIRESTPGGLPGVQVLALPHKGTVEIACNVESVKGSPPSQQWPSFCIGGQPYCHVPASVIAHRVAELAGQHGVGTTVTPLVGFTPLDCRKLAEKALSLGIAEFWKEQRSVHM